jgi:phospholipid/cholesterol/gamma-HCH transport system ATP-binding protein
MLYPQSRLEAGESQILFDGTPEEIDRSQDRRVAQFVRGEAGDRLMEMRQEKSEV